MICVVVCTNVVDLVLVIVAFFVCVCVWFVSAVVVGVVVLAGVLARLLLSMWSMWLPDVCYYCCHHCCVVPCLMVPSSFRVVVDLFFIFLPDNVKQTMSKVGMLPPTRWSPLWMCASRP